MDLYFSKPANYRESRSGKGRKVSIRYLLISVLLSLCFSPIRMEAESGQIIVNHSFRDQVACIKLELREKMTLGTSYGKGWRPAILSWTTSGIWHDGLLFLADMSRGPLAMVEMDGTVESKKQLKFTREKGTEIGKIKEEIGVAWFVHPRKNGYLVGKYDYEKIDDRYRTVSKILFVNAEGKIENYLQPMNRIGVDAFRGEKVVSTGVFRMVPMDDGVFMVGDVKPFRSNGEYWTSFAYLDNNVYRPFHIPLNGQESMQELGNKYYSRDFSLITSIESDVGGDVAFVLVMERSPWIGQVRQGDMEISLLVDLSNQFIIPSFENKEKFLNQSDAMRFYRDLYRKVENSSMPIGLFSWSGRLFLLVKGPSNPHGLTDWYAYEVAVAEQRLKRRPITLPVSSAHIALIPGSSKGDPFVLIEKGPISINRGGALPDLLHRSTRTATVLSELWFLQAPGETVMKSTCTTVSVGLD